MVEAPRARALVLGPHRDRAEFADDTDQRLKTWPREWDKLRGSKLNDENMGRILAWETSREYDYVCGDATNSYSPKAVKSFTRQLGYVR